MINITVNNYRSHKIDTILKQYIIKKEIIEKNKINYILKDDKQVVSILKCIGIKI